MIYVCAKIQQKMGTDKHPFPFFSSHLQSIARILDPAWVQVEHLLLDREDTMTLVEVSIGEVLVVWEELILEVAEANHVVTTPVLIEELTTTLIIDVL